MAERSPLVQTPVASRTAVTALMQDEKSIVVKEAAKYLGVSPQSAYLRVERKQIPNLRVMDRNISRMHYLKRTEVGQRHRVGRRQATRREQPGQRIRGREGLGASDKGV